MFKKVEENTIMMRRELVYTQTDPHDLGLSVEFLNLIPKACFRKGKIDKSDLIKI